jgi:hypothetical protein
MIPKSVKRFSEKIMPQQRTSDRSDSTKLNQTWSTRGTGSGVTSMPL